MDKDNQISAFQIKEPAPEEKKEEQSTIKNFFIETFVKI